MPEWPRIAVGLGNQLHVVWFVRDAENLFNSDAGNYQVWYATRTTNSPAIAPVAVPDIPPPTPPPVLDQPLVVALPTSQIKPVVVEQIALPQDALLPNIRSENDEVLLIALATLPVLALVAAAAGVFALQRRRRAG